MSDKGEASQAFSDEGSQASSGAPRENSHWADVRASPPSCPSDSMAASRAGAPSMTATVEPQLTLNKRQWPNMKHMTCAFWLRGGCKFDAATCQYAHFDTGRHADKPRPPTGGYPAMAGNNLKIYERELRRRESGRSVMSPTARPFVPGLPAASASDNRGHPPPCARGDSSALGSARQEVAPAFARGNPPPRTQWGQTVDARSQPGARIPSSLPGQNGNNNGRPSGRPSARFGNQRTAGPQISRFGGGLGQGSWRDSQGYQGSSTNARANHPGMADINRGGSRGGRDGRGGRSNTDLGNASSNSNAQTQ